ncbi:hypothetical protein GF385_00505 [Candidatus Dependentiae bacterium]|nr:hypothetical protein [Candidatus Dependentiae bacterium]
MREKRSDDLGGSQVISNSFLTALITWVVNLSYIVAILPQIYLNYKIKSTKGLSDYYLVGYFNGYAANFFYVFTLNFHLAYRIKAIFAVLAIAFMIFQRFKYDQIYKNNKIKRLYVSDFSLLFLITPIIFSFPKVAGHVVGWILVFIWSLYQLPQILKIYRRKSVEGFSFFLVSLIGIGNIIELFIAYIFNYPIQTHLIAIRGIIIFLIYMFQFSLYSKNNNFITIKEKILKK